jgi:hypothetical protein
MGFITPCFIRKNTPELRKKLEYLGYSHGKPEYYADDDDNKYDFIMCHNGRFFLLSQENHVIRNGHPLKKHGSINCGTNEELFLAIASLRDDTSVNQYWVFDQDFPPHYQKGDFTMGYFHRCSCYCHVATVNELIELFSQKIQVPQIEWNINDVINKD